MATDKKKERAFIIGAALELLGIVALAARFGPKIGGITLLLTGSVLLVVGVAMQVRALTSLHKSSRM